MDSQEEVKTGAQTQICLLNFDISYITQLCKHQKYKAGGMAQYLHYLHKKAQQWDYHSKEAETKKIPEACWPLIIAELVAAGPGRQKVFRGNDQHRSSTSI